jgi:hypothetical protein
MKYKVIDNFLSKNDFSNIKELFEKKLPWYFNDFVTYKSEKKDFYFTHIFYNNNTLNSDFMEIVRPIINLINIKALIRIKANLYPRTHTIYEHDSHSDYDFKHNGLLYYINTNNGFTKLSNGTKIESIENRALFFDSSLFHNSSTCTDEKCRININFNYF